MSSILLPQTQNSQITLLLWKRKCTVNFLTTLNVQFEEILRQTGNKNNRDDQFGDMVLIVRFSGLNNE